MPRNSKDELLADVLTMPFISDAHITRVGLICSTIDHNPIVFVTKKDKERLLEADIPPTLEMPVFPSPLTVQFEGDHRLFFLLVPRDTGYLEVYPFSDLHSDDRKIWAYDFYFDIDKDMNARYHAIHPLAEREELDENGMSHMHALAVLALRLASLYRYGKITFEESSEDLTKINKKRAKLHREKLHPDNFIKWEAVC